MRISTLIGSLFRKKHFEGGSHLHSKLTRCLSVLDVMFIAIGHMIGAGIYVLTGQVVANEAGPATIISYLLAGFAALLSAFSYAEFGARFPRAGSAYTYTYVALGEICAFIIGWTVPLEYMIGNAAVARSWSSYFDTLIDGAVRNLTTSTVGHLSERGGFFAEYPDILAFVLIIIVAIIVAMGSKLAARLNTTFVFINLTVLAVIIVYGFTFADFGLWSGVDEAGKSRFFPFGVSGALSGAAKCFFAFIGFEALATAGEEAKNPHRTIPLATFGSLAIISTLYVLMTASLTLMIPYNQVDPDAAYAKAFSSKGATVAMFIITIGALLGMFNNLVTGAFALPRAVYAMADDGLIFRIFSVINEWTKTPLNATIVFTILNAFLALIFDLHALVEFMSIGTLLAYSVVSVCVLIIRHQPMLKDSNSSEFDDGGKLKPWVPFRLFWDQFPAQRSIQISVFGLILGFVLLALPFRLDIYSTPPGIILLIIAATLTILSFAFILGHEENKADANYKVPFVPYIPSLSLLINIFMMVYLDAMTWVRLLVWLAVGLSIYACYGWRNSTERSRQDHKVHSVMIGLEKPVSNIGEEM